MKSQTNQPQKPLEVKKRIVCMGGGTGTFVTLKGLKSYGQKLSAIVSMSDSGGSNKRIRDEFGLLPTSDLRQCLVALSDENGGVGILRKLFMYRFDKGKGLSGMTFGNLFMAALTDIVGSQKEAIIQTTKVLRIRGTIVPVTLTNSDLIATYEDGSVVREEHLIDEPKHDGTLKITNLMLKPSPKANPDAISKILKADMIVLGPGDLFTSVLPNMLVQGIPEALKKTKGHIVYIVNLMTKWGQTYGFTAKNHIDTIESYIGRHIDTVLINTGSISPKALRIYGDHKEYPVIDDLPKNTYYDVIRENLVGKHIIKKSHSDSLVRSLIRHDSDLLAAELMNILNNHL